MTTTDIKRVYGNIAVLLQQGVFAGNTAGALAEAQQFLTGFLAQLDAAAPAAPAAETANDGQQAG